MKKVNFLVIAIIVAAFIIGCSNEAPKEENAPADEQKTEEAQKEEAPEQKAEEGICITGTWTFESLDMGADLPEDQKQMVDAMVESMQGSTITFDKEGKYVQTGKSSEGEEETKEGTFKLNDDKTQLTIVKADGSEDISEIVELSANKLVISQEANGMKSTMSFTR